MTSATVSSLSDILKYQNEVARTNQIENLGRLQKIAIGPNAAWTPSAQDAILQKFGRFIELRDCPLPLAQTVDRSMLIVPALLRDKQGRVALPDLPDPNWKPGLATKEEVEGLPVVRNGSTVRAFPNDKDWPGGPVSSARVAPLIPQSLEARAEGLLEGTNFLVFSPVEAITFQPEINKRLVGDAWLIKCHPNNADGTRMALLIDRATGEIHFYGGAFEILGNSPK